MFDDQARHYIIVINDEEQYSIWPADREPPPGWSAVGQPRSRAQCLSWIEQVWTDMRPKSVRQALEVQARADR